MYMYSLEEVVDPWIEGFWPALAKVCRQTTTTATTATSNDNNSISKLSNVLIAPSLSTPPTANTPVLQEVVSASLETEIKNEINELTTKVTELTTHQDRTTNDITPYPAYVMDLDTAALDEGLSKLTNLAKSPPALCKLIDTTSVQTNATHEPPIFFAPPSPLLYARLRGARTLTAPTAVKRTLHLALAIMANADEHSVPLNDELDLLPGDTFGILCQNDSRLVQAILEQLNAIDNADQPIKVKSLVEADALPSHLSLASQLTSTTRRELLTHALDLTSVLRKTTLRLLADVATDLDDKKKLLYLSSKQGNILCYTIH
jgi:sulfite reductase alpha subunit-like flavoprotein